MIQHHITILNLRLSKCLRHRQLDRGISAGCVLNKMLKRRRGSNPRRERLKVPEIAESAQDRRSRIGHNLSIRVSALLLDLTLSNPRRDQESRDATTETVKGERILLTGRRDLGVRQVIRAGGQRGRDVVVETACLIEGEDQECLFPLWAGAECVVDILDEGFTFGNETGWVHGVCAHATAGGVNEGEFRERASCRISVEGIQGDCFVGVAACEGPVEEVGINQIRTGVVILPGVVGF